QGGHPREAQRTAGRSAGDAQGYPARAGRLLCRLRPPSQGRAGGCAIGRVHAERSQRQVAQESQRRGQLLAGTAGRMVRRSDRCRIQRRAGCVHSEYLRGVDYLSRRMRCGRLSIACTDSAIRTEDAAATAEGMRVHPYFTGSHSMSADLPKLFLARHGDTAWTDSHQHTGRTDIPLSARGEEHARQLGERLRGFSFVGVFTSPLQRASKTCELAGFGAVSEVDADLREWDYGRWEGTLTSDIQKDRPGWELFRDGCPGGESPQDVAARADRFIARIRGMAGDVLAFSSGHIIRMIAARWHGMAPA